MIRMNWNSTHEFYDKVTKKIEEKNKKMFYMYNKAGDDYKAAIFDTCNSLESQQLV